jgi:probable HAF family extracellular repeat protein
MRPIACIIVFTVLIGLAPAAFASDFTFSTIDVPGAFSTEALGINNAGQIVGFFKDNTGAGQHGFLYDRGIFTTIDVPGATGTIPFGINNARQIVGTTATSTGIHGFLYDGGTFTTIDVPGAQETEAHGINDAGQIVGDFVDNAGLHGFLYHDGTFTAIDAPGAQSTQAFRINDDCIRDALKLTHPTIPIVPADQFRQLAFPGLSPPGTPTQGWRSLEESFSRPHISAARRRAWRAVSDTRDGHGG